MPHPNFVSSLAMEAQAERELAAFLRAASELADHDNIRRAGDTWLQTMEFVDCPDEDHEKFFRRVTILAIFQLLAKSDTPARGKKPGPNRGINRPAVSRRIA